MRLPSLFSLWQGEFSSHVKEDVPIHSLPTLCAWGTPGSPRSFSSIDWVPLPCSWAALLAGIQVPGPKLASLLPVSAILLPPLHKLPTAPMAPKVSACRPHIIYIWETQELSSSLSIMASPWHLQHNTLSPHLPCQKLLPPSHKLWRICNFKKRHECTFFLCFSLAKKRSEASF